MNQILKEVRIMPNLKYLLDDLDEMGDSLMPDDEQSGE
jgi:hypothetical protein